MTDLEALRQEVIDGCQVLAVEGQNDLIWGHLSVRDPADRGAWMKPAKIGLEEVTAERIVLVDREGEVLDGGGARHAEYPIHLEVMAARPDVGCVVHTHAPAVVALGATGAPLRPISHEGTLFAPDALPRFELTSDLILDRELGEAVAKCLGSASALMLINHGLVTCGSTVAEAVMVAVLLDRACRMQLLTMAAATEFLWTNDEEALQKRTHCYSPGQLADAYAFLLRGVTKGGMDG